MALAQGQVKAEVFGARRRGHRLYLEPAAKFDQPIPDDGVQTTRIDVTFAPSTVPTLLVGRQW